MKIPMTKMLIFDCMELMKLGNEISNIVLLRLDSECIPYNILEITELKIEDKLSKYSVHQGPVMINYSTILIEYVVRVVLRNMIDIASGYVDMDYGTFTMMSLQHGVENAYYQDHRDIIDVTYNADLSEEEVNTLELLCNETLAELYEAISKNNYDGHYLMETLNGLYEYIRQSLLDAETAVIVKNLPYIDLRGNYRLMFNKAMATTFYLIPYPPSSG